MVANLKSEHLVFFKNAMEGSNKTSLAHYIKKNQDDFSEALPRAQFLRLKFNPIDEIEKLLKSSGISFDKNEAALKMEKYILGFHPDVMDEDGLIKKDHRNSLFHGLIKAFEGNDKDAAQKIFNNYIEKCKGTKNKKAIENLEELESFSEMEFLYNNREFGFYVLDQLTRSERHFSDFDDVVLKASEFLEKNNKLLPNSSL